ncbi:hypothetical protein ACODNH_21130 (plasmid) [Haloarcula sp. NS06]|uniref:hypothetical protein n=1 Tax=Haloarcula sp. NS06 TaxID=3409688 RepID=UPI003DA6DB66
MLATAGQNEDLVVLLGDLIQDGPDPATDRRRLDALRSHLNDPSAPYRAIPGNYNLDNFDAEGLAAVLDDPLWGVDVERDLVF